MFMQTKPKKIIIRNDDFDPWGKGFGNPAWDPQGNVHRHKFAPSAEEGVPDPQAENGMTLGLRRNRGGDGAPHFTESGHPRTRLKNTLKNIKAMGPHIDDEHEAYNPWGRPGAGAPFQREDGKPFEEKLGWSMTGHPKKRSKDAKMEYMNTLQKEIEERKKKEQEDRLQSQEPGAELASIIRKGAGGRPRKDPITGELLPNPRKLTDVTEKSLDIRRAKSQESLIYFNELSEQAEQRQRMRQQQKLVERAQSEKVIKKLDKTFTDVPKFVLRRGSKSKNSSHPFPPTPHGGFRVSFLDSTRGSNVGRSFVLPLASQRGPQKFIRPIQSDFKLSGIPPLPFRYSSFHRFLKLTIGVSLPCSENSKVEQR
ncbi:hypothetical protein AVEN_178985-1 [Araneus ventricosus]|uniref:Uncharacterized protein n=1 Tax=Araneus ventricosus TaxID=182803 RepID=A0A4Y2MTM0_ARAVE|nr:hypothetical protein AVEN_178985-1 [Araneus ventricosus]